MQDGWKAVWSIPYVSVTFCQSLKHNDKVSQTFLSIQVDLTVVVWMVSILPPISKCTNSFLKYLGTVQIVPI